MKGLVRLGTVPGIVAAMIVAGVAGASVERVTKGSLPARTAGDVTQLTAREGAVVADLKAFSRIGTSAQVSGWVDKLRSDEAAQAKALALLGADLTVKKASAPANGDLRVIAQGHAAGDYAIAQASGTANAPHRIAIAVSATPPQSGTVSWNLVCSEKSGGVGSKSGQSTIHLPGTLNAPLPAPSQSCLVAANVQLQASGTVTIAIESA
ncbi:MAG: hypothetical protein M0004_11955 [Actinomycetota bacterium]|nr:hypothetical protein [Actinomycetota bacterium]